VRIQASWDVKLCQWLTGHDLHTVYAVPYGCQEPLPQQTQLHISEDRKQHLSPAYTATTVIYDPF